MSRKPGVKEQIVARAQELGFDESDFDELVRQVIAFFVRRVGPQEMFRIINEPAQLTFRPQMDVEFVRGEIVKKLQQDNQRPLTSLDHRFLLFYTLQYLLSRADVAQVYQGDTSNLHETVPGLHVEDTQPSQPTGPLPPMPGGIGHAQGAGAGGSDAPEEDQGNPEDPQTRVLHWKRNRKKR